MLTVRYFLGHARNRSVTAAICVELMARSTITHRFDTTLAPPAWTPLPHPPHPHAHIRQDGFHNPVTATETAGYHALLGRPGPRTREEAATLGRYEARVGYGLESRHLDPAERHAMNHEHRIVDPARGRRYINRTKHSQFEDAEVAVMALTYALNSEAGEAAMTWLLTANARAVLTSHTAAQRLGNVLPYNRPPATLSAHPQRGATPNVIERGVGSAGAAGHSSLAIVAVVSVLTSDAAGNLGLVTHYPVSAHSPRAAPLAANQDRVERQGGTPASTDYPVDAGSGLTWSRTPRWFHSSTVDEVCILCSTVHGRMWSSVFGRWHRCQACQAVYCPKCGKGLPSAGSFTRTRRCTRPTCAGTTALID
jgi:hypothetical protein